MLDVEGATVGRLDPELWLIGTLACDPTNTGEVLAPVLVGAEPELREADG
jgi:hypothetical protein